MKNSVKSQQQQQQTIEGSQAILGVEETQGGDNERKIFYGKITLVSGISPLNFYAYLVFNSVIVGLMVYLELSKIMLLTGPKYMHLTNEQAALVVADILLVERLSTLAVTPTIGTLYDRWGRKQVLILGTVCASTVIFIMPRLHVAYPFFLICRAFMLNSGNLFSNAPIIGDYVNTKTKGAATGLFYFCASFASVFCQILSTFILKNFELIDILTVISVVQLVNGVICSSLLKGGKYFLVTEKQKKNEEKFSVYVKKGLKSLSKKRWLVIAMFKTLLSKVEIFLMSSYVVLWTKSFYSKDQETESNILSSQLVLTITIPMSASKSIFGFLFNKYKKKYLTGASYLFVFFGSGIFIVVNDPHSFIMRIGLVFLGIGLAGLQVGTYYYQMKYCDNENRGLVMGISSVVTSIGGLLVTYVGIMLYNSVSKLMPMLIYFGLIVFSIIMSIVVLILIKEQEENPNNENEQPNDSDTQKLLVNDEVTKK